MKERQRSALLIRRCSIATTTGLDSDGLIDIAVTNGLHYDAATQQGVMFHLIGALPRYGKVGALCVGDSPARAARMYRTTVDTLTREASAVRRQRRS